MNPNCRSRHRFRHLDCGNFVVYRQNRTRETLHKARLTALHAICLQIFRHIAQKSLARQLRSRQDSAREQRRVALRLIATTKSACGISMQSAEKSDDASYAQVLCSVSLGEVTQRREAVWNT